MNVNTNILAKTLSHRLDQVFHKVIHKNQVGFIFKGHGSDIAHLATEAVPVIQKFKIPMALLALDAEKAFDSFFLEVPFCALGKQVRWALEKNL